MGKPPGCGEVEGDAQQQVVERIHASGWHAHVYFPSEIRL